MHAEHRPWGMFEILSDDSSHKVKRLTVDPGQRLSLQRHARRSEHWFVVAGEGLVTIEGVAQIVGAGCAVDVPAGAAHRVENNGTSELVLIEVQHGSYFGEDDIERLADDFGRA
jgi:mannose-6-phosphate isomerase